MPDTVKKCNNLLMRVTIMFGCCLIVQALFAVLPGTRPKFSDYPVGKVYRGKPAPPVITKQFRMMRTMIQRGADSDVEFAGHYTVPRWGCGADCNGFVIVDSVSGKIYDGLAVEELLKWEDAHPNVSVARMEFHPNSRLMKINACPNETDCGFYDYVMVDGKGLKLVRKDLLPQEFQP